MQRKSSFLLASFLLVLLHSLSAQSAPSIALDLIATGLVNPIGVTHADDGSGRLFITLQGGKIVIYNGTQILPKAFLELTSRVSCCGEQGLLGVAFHPQYKTNGLFFVNYTDALGNTVVARYQVSSDPNVADPNSAIPILSVAQPDVNHNGGQLHFGPDGYLYISMGDGGGAGDPGNRSQNLSELLGKMLRIDVNSGLPYAIPASNPFITRSGARKEIWAYGLRNAWGFSFDRSTGDLFMGDVGQERREEVDFQPAASPGGENYGWRKMEGSLCYNPATGCNDGTLKLPILEYDHSLGCSITGGYRYRGSQYPALAGIYIYGDFCSGRIWGATRGASSWTTAQLLDTALNISAFGEDQAGELYLAHRNGVSGAVYKVISSTSGEIIIDNAPAGVQDAAGGRTFTGTWCVTGASGKYGSDSLYSCGSAGDTYRWTPNIPAAGAFDVYVRWTSATSRATAVPFRIVHSGGTTTKSFNQQTGGGAWVLHGRYSFSAGKLGYAETNDLGGQASADALRFVPAATPTGAVLTVSKSGSGTGRVTTVPAGIDCGATCSASFALGVTLTVTANADAGSVFTGWGGPCAGTAPCTLTMNDSKFLAANFRGPDIVLDNAARGVQDSAGGRTFTGTWCLSAAKQAFGSQFALQLRQRPRHLPLDAEHQGYGQL